MEAEYLETLLATPTTWLHRDTTGRVNVGHAAGRVLFPGSFNPLHHGHRTLATLAAEQLGAAVTFELSIANVDKPPLALAEVQRRLSQFTDANLVVTCAPLFRTKALLFPGTTFVIGADTAVRILDAKYYPHGAAGIRDALTIIEERGCRFFVGGRVNGTTFLEVAQLPIPERFGRLFAGLSEDQFRVDVSSTELRRC